MYVSVFAYAADSLYECFQVMLIIYQFSNPLTYGHIFRLSVLGLKKASKFDLLRNILKQYLNF